MKTPRRRLRLLYWLGGLLLIAGLVAGSWWMLAPRRPNLLLITLDTTRADRLGCYGYDGAKTPTLDALANSGARFSRAYATAPLTLPSHATMMTGLYTPEHGLRTNGKGRLHSEIPTLAESLQQAGYRTGGFVGAFVLDAEFGLNQGFDEYDADLSQSRRTDDPLHRERPGNAVVDRALAWLGADANEPFFCWVHLYDPHFVYQSHAAEFGDEFEQRPYDGELAFVDQQVQRLTGFLTSNEIAEDTLVIIVGDHGEGLGDHQEMMHGYMLYNSTLHVPWIVSWPGRIPSDVVVDEPVSLVDLMPTTLDCLGVPPPLDMTGQSLKPAFT
ncbi:MAG: sulfatase, partial [Planctomycetaceae bacterium]|nr:sulfatase [Planctomycetaceae bacterium]